MFSARLPFSSSFSPPASSTVTYETSLPDPSGACLIGWPCRIHNAVGSTESSGFNLVPVMIWTNGRCVMVAHMSTKGLVDVNEIQQLEFDTKWKRE